MIAVCGQLYAQAEILRIGNEKLLNNLNEGVVILDEQHKDVMFANLAAHALKTGRTFPGAVLDEESSFNEIQNETAPFNHSVKQFARID